mmetsp:Transcript_88057/g.174751  ORF Transcript_88057/g.174751 Transcript_88057/m.174751 type:complete len:230 (+) Transcript_88057:122-811(+)
MPGGRSLADALAERRRTWTASIVDCHPHLSSEAEPAPFIFLGKGRDAEDLTELQAHGITHILNCADDVPNFHEDSGAGLLYQRLEITDFGGDEGSSRTFGKAIEFAREAQSADGRLLIHCANGSNRSATVTCAVLMALHDWSLREAWDIVKSRREQALPLSDNQSELLKFEQRFRADKPPSMMLDDFYPRSIRHGARMTGRGSPSSSQQRPATEGEATRAATCHVDSIT